IFTNLYVFQLERNLSYFQFVSERCMCKKNMLQGTTTCILPISRLARLARLHQILHRSRGFQLLCLFVSGVDTSERKLMRGGSFCRAQSRSYPSSCQQ
ncbi:hypothetical protein PENTCL1PPCAC_7991, partial [Pristionchus entomophagus]